MVPVSKFPKEKLELIFFRALSIATLLKRHKLVCFVYGLQWSLLSLLLRKGYEKLL